MTADIEQVLIARLLVEPEHIAGLAGSLNASDFTHPASARTWSAMQRLAAEGRPIDIAVIRAEGVEPGEPTRVLTSAHTAPVEEYARRIREAGYKRRVEQALASVLGEVERLTDPADIALAVQKVTASVITIPHGTGDEEPEPIIDIIRRPKAARSAGMPYGLPNLDAVVPPAHPGNMIVLAGYAGIGKSWTSLGIIRHWARDAKYPVLFASLEMSKEEVADRFLLYGDDIESYPLLYVEADPRLTTAGLRSKAARLRMTHGGLTAMSVDYMQLLTDRPEIAETHERVTGISRELKALAREFHCPMLALSQFNREGERAGRKPRLSDLAQSGAIERDADAVFGLWKEKRTDDYVDIGILKHRHGPTGAWVREDFALARHKREAA